VEFSLAIPATQQFKDGWTRSIVRRSLSDVLPEKVQWRPWKTAVNEAFWNALSVEDDRLGTLIANPGPLARYVDPDSLDDARARFNEDPNSRDGRALWRALSLSVWLDEFYPAAATER
jgi:asparagine synthase (glutamine-hydrolysing)